MINPEKDGIDHINIYSMGKTELGRFLTNFADKPFVHPEDGKFQSVEGYWYWLSSKDDELRKLTHLSAKKYGRSIGAKDWLEDEDFKRKIKLAIMTKIITYKMDEEVVYCNLPFKHYYVYYGKVIEPKEAQWLTDWFNTLRIENET